MIWRKGGVDMKIGCQGFCSVSLSMGVWRGKFKSIAVERKKMERKILQSEREMNWIEIEWSKKHSSGDENSCSSWKSQRMNFLCDSICQSDWYRYSDEKESDYGCLLRWRRVSINGKSSHLLMKGAKKRFVHLVVVLSRLSGVPMFHWEDRSMLEKEFVGRNDRKSSKEWEIGRELVVVEEREVKGDLFGKHSFCHLSWE